MTKRRPGERQPDTASGVVEVDALHNTRSACNEPPLGRAHLVFYTVVGLGHGQTEGLTTLNCPSPNTYRKLRLILTQLTHMATQSG